MCFTETAGEVSLRFRISTDSGDLREKSPAHPKACESERQSSKAERSGERRIECLFENWGVTVP